MLLYHLPDLAGARLARALAARGIEAEWDRLTIDGLDRVSLRGVGGRRRGLRFEATRVTAELDVWARRPRAVHVHGLRAQLEPGPAGRSAGDAARTPSAVGPGWPIHVWGAELTLARGSLRARATLREAHLDRGVLTAHGVDAKATLDQRVTLEVRDQSVRVGLAGRRIEVGAVSVGWPLQQTVRDAWLAQTAAGLAAGGALFGGTLAAHVAGRPDHPDVLEVEARGLDLGALADFAAARGRGLPVDVGGRLDGQVTVVDPLGEGPVVAASGALRDAWLQHPRVGPERVDVSLAGSVTGARDPVTGAADARLQLRRGAAVAHVDLQADGLNRAATVALTATLDPLPCQAAYDALPKGLLGPYGRAILTGDFRPWVSLRLPLSDPRSLRFRWQGVQGACPVTALRASAPAVARTPRGDLHDVDWLLQPFTRAVPEARRPVRVGPGHPSYVPLSRLPAYVPAVMYLSEDPAFFGHGGISGHLIQRALMLDLAERRYVYGGSTLPQQLVKNLFLARTKTLARKLQEALLAARVADVVPKRRILELYLNCIEFAPNVYGIERAARHYFGVSARQLTPKQAVFLATAKPSPRYADQLRRRGATPDTAHYRTYMRRLFDRLLKVGAVTAEQVAAARPFQIRWRPP